MISSTARRWEQSSKIKMQNTKQLERRLLKWGLNRYSMCQGCNRSMTWPMNAEREWASKKTKSSKIYKILRPRWSGHKLSISHTWTRKAWKQRHSHWQWTSQFKEWRSNKNNDSWKYMTSMWTLAEWDKRTVLNDIGWSSERCNTISDETLCSISRMLRTTERRWKKLREKVTETASDKSSLHETVPCLRYSQPGSIS